MLGELTKHTRWLAAGCVMAVAAILLGAITFRHSGRPVNTGKIPFDNIGVPADSAYQLGTAERDFIEAERARISREGSRLQEKHRLEIEKRKREDNVYIRTSIKTPIPEKKTYDGKETIPGVSGPNLAERKKHPIPGFDVVIDKNTKIRMVVLPGGSFNMGSIGHEWDEKFIHTVRLDGFCMSATEITQFQFKSIMGYNVGYFRGDDNLPIEQITWHEAAYFCNRLSDETGRERCYNEETWVCDFSKNGFRLPTEAEWEYACRAGTTTVYYTGNGDETLQTAAWYRDNSDKRTHPVGQKEPNTWGLYDMLGNVWEWCNDWYSEDYYRKSPEVNPRGPEKGTFVVIRGGAWAYYPYPTRSSHRGFIKPTFKYNYIGFRIVCSG